MRHAPKETHSKKKADASEAANASLFDLLGRMLGLFLPAPEKPRRVAQPAGELKLKPVRSSGAHPTSASPSRRPAVRISAISDRRDSVIKPGRQGLIQKINDLERDWRGGLPTTPSPLAEQIRRPPRKAVAEPSKAPVLQEFELTGDFADQAALLFAEARWDECEACLRIAAIDASGTPAASHARRAVARQLLLVFYRSRGDLARAATIAVDIFLATRAPDQSGALGSVSNLLGKAITWVSPPILDARALGELSGLLCLGRPLIADWRKLQGIAHGASESLREAIVQFDAHTELVAHAGLPFLYQQTRSHYRKNPSPSSRSAGYAFLALLQHLAMEEPYYKHSLEFCRRFEETPPVWRKGTRRSADLEVLLAHFPSAPAGSNPHRQIPHGLSGEIHGADHPQVKQLASICNAAKSDVLVDCSALVRIDFVAAGELFNIHLALRSRRKSLILLNTHPLLSLFLAPMQFKLDEK